jgi:hypothetical protein
MLSSAPLYLIVSRCDVPYGNETYERNLKRIMPNSGMLRRVAIVITDVSEELSASFIKVRRTSELGTLDVTSS